MTALIYYTHADVSVANVPMLYLLVVTTAAFFLGSWPAILASILAFLAFDWYFIEPKYQFTVQDPAEWLALCTFLITSTMTGQLTALLRKRAAEAQTRKLETAALAEASWAVASELDRDRALAIVVLQMAQVIKPEYAAVLLFDSQAHFRTIADFSDPNSPVTASITTISSAVLTEKLSAGQPIGWEHSELWQKALKGIAPPGVYLPIILENQVLGAVYLKLKPEHTVTAGEKQVVESLLNHCAVIVQRDKLMKAQAKAQALAEADKLKTALLSMVSHDFRSPLTSIKASVSSLLEEGEPLDTETQRSLLQAVVQETDRLNRMVGNILDLSRLEAGAWRPKSEITEVTELIGSALDSFSEANNQRIQVTVDSEVAFITADPVQIVQVVRNLIENALKYSPPASTVELTVTSKDDAVLIAVLDRGGGLPKGDEQQIFEPFYRGPALKESSVPGVGIGLALCRGLVEVNGGVLTAVNREGGGAVFRVELPAYTAPANVIVKNQK